MNRRRLLVALAVAAVTCSVVPDSALAHGIAGREDLPIPKWLFGWAATVVLIASFVGLAILWPRPRLEQPSERRVASLPRVLDPLCGALGVAVFALVVYAGFAGEQSTPTNIAPTFVFVIFWVGLAIVSLLFGDVFKTFNPWRAVARTAAAIVTTVSRRGLPPRRAYPAALGRWPAALGILAFVWVELVYSARGDPSTVATLALAYATVQLIGMSLYGIETWNRNGDAFGVYFGLFARLSPVRWERGALYRRMPLGGVTALDPVPGTVALVCIMIGTTSFDGLLGGALWADLELRLTTSQLDLGVELAKAQRYSLTIGLILSVLFIAGLYRLGLWGMRRVTRTEVSIDDLAGRFAHTLVPIALAYVIAHYFSLIAFQGQSIFYLVSDPLGEGANFFGTARETIDYAWVSANTIWYVQVGALVIGHVAALILAHDRALIEFKDGRVATRSQYCMLAVMIAFTCLGLWLLSADS